jgi:hypothetical protein
MGISKPVRGQLDGAIKVQQPHELVKVRTRGPQDKIKDVDHPRHPPDDIGKIIAAAGVAVKIYEKNF